MSRRKLILKTDWQDALKELASEHGWSQDDERVKDLITNHIPNGNQWLTQTEFEEWCEYMMERYIETINLTQEDLDDYIDWINNREYF